MGANPRWFTLALTLPLKYAKPAWLKEFSVGLAEVAKDFNCALIGGDTTSGPLTISITMLGEVISGMALKRSGANVGDSIYVTAIWVMAPQDFLLLPTKILEKVLVTLFVSTCMIDFTGHSLRSQRVLT